jgi:hypothetical protein
MLKSSILTEQDELFAVLAFMKTQPLYCHDLCNSEQVKY